MLCPAHLVFCSLLVQENKSMLDTVQHRKFRWIGHILRQDSLLRDIIEGRMKGKVTRGRKRLQMLSDVISKSYEELKRDVEVGGRKGRHKPAIQGRKPTSLLDIRDV